MVETVANDRQPHTWTVTMEADEEFTEDLKSEIMACIHQCLVLSRCKKVQRERPQAGVFEKFQHKWKWHVYYKDSAASPMQILHNLETAIATFC